MLNISSYTSQNSTSILSSNMDIASLPSSPSSSSSYSSTFVAGGRTLDRHNPIITDEKRSGFSTKPGTPIGTPHTNHVLQQKPKTPTTTTTTTFSPTPQLNSPTTPKKKTNKKSLLKKTANTIPESTFGVDNKNPNLYNDKEGYSEQPDKITKAVTCDISRANNVEHVSPPESSRYLLDDTSFLDVLSGFDPTLKLDPSNGSKSDHVQVSEFDASSKTPKHSSTSSGSTDQVVVLRVSLHCRGCERKMKKHLSRMSGVTSFNIDFAAKKVTVIGDVTPLQVLANISKVKTAKLWSPTMPTSSHINTKNLEAKE